MENKQRKSRSRSLTLCAVFIAMFVALYALFPISNRIVQGILAVISPVPIALVCLIATKKWGLLTIAACTAVSFLLLQPYTTLFFAVPGMIIGYLFGALMAQKSIKPLFTVMIASGIFFAFNITEILAYHAFLGIDVFSIINEFAGQVTAILANMNMSSLTQSIAGDIIIYMLPVGLAALSILKAIISYNLISAIYKRIECGSISGKPRIDVKQLRTISKTRGNIEV